MKRGFGVVLLVLLVASGCTMGAGGDTRVVQVDYRNDRFGSHYWRYFPRSIEAHPGDTVIFRQQWTGEPHTVTFGKIVDSSLRRLDALEKELEDFDFENAPPDEQRAVERRYEAATEGLPSFDAYRDADAQNAEQPCYLRNGVPPTDPNTPCAADRRTQPIFDGRHSYYSSGFLPPAGASGSQFKMRIADDAATGTFRYYCVIHFPFMQGELRVKAEPSEIESAAEVNARANEEIRELSAPLERAFAQASEGGVRTEGTQIRPPIAGYHSGDEFTVAIDSFIPKRITTKVGKPVTWTIVGAHTVSFGVPRYLPIYIVQSDGTVRRNRKVDRPAGGSPPIPPVDFERHTYRIDGGTYDGTGFYSSGLLGSEPYSTYTLRFSKPGRYRYACLVHPPMVGTVIVEP